MSDLTAGRGVIGNEILSGEGGDTHSPVLPSELRPPGVTPPPVPTLPDELQKQYVVTARAKGLGPFRTLVKSPLRMSLNFFISDIGSILPAIISGAEITAVVLSLETTGPMLIKALQSQDMYLAGSFLMFLAFLTVIGVLISDLALAALDPRIRLQGGSTK